MRRAASLKGILRQSEACTEPISGRESHLPVVWELNTAILFRRASGRGKCACPWIALGATVFVRNHPGFVRCDVRIGTGVLRPLTDFQVLSLG